MKIFIMMNMNKDLEIKFLQAIKKDNNLRTEEDKKAIDERNDFVYKHYELIKKDIYSIQRLNIKLELEEKRIFPFYQKLVDENDKLVRDNVIDDFNIELIIKCFSDNYLRFLYPEMEGNPICETENHFISHLEHNEFDDWQDASVPELLRDFKHCYSFHHLYDHTDLTWFDLSLIQDVWLEIKVDYQFFSRISY